MKLTLIKPTLSIIIVNWNGWDNLNNCLVSLFKSSIKGIEIVIVDNGSKDDSILELKRLIKVHSNIKLIQNKENLGFAEGNNIGYQHSQGELVLFLNNDTIVDKNFLKPLIKKLLSNSKIGAVQPKILNYPDKKIIDSIGSYFLNSGFLYHFGHNKEDRAKYDKPSKIFTMKGACMLFKREVLEKVGLFDNDYFAYFEETDLCHRALLAGYSIYYVPESKIFHLGGETSKKLSNAFVNYHSYKNRIYTYLKNFELSMIFKIVPLHLLLCEMISLLYLFTFRYQLALAIQKAILWNILHLPRLLVDRRNVQKIRRVRDSQYLTNLVRPVRFSYYYHLFTTALAGYKD